jgi:hypothetical protein
MSLYVDNFHEDSDTGSGNDDGVSSSLSRTPTLSHLAQSDNDPLQLHEQLIPRTDNGERQVALAPGVASSEPFPLVPSDPSPPWTPGVWSRLPSFGLAALIRVVLGKRFYIFRHVCRNALDSTLISRQQLSLRLAF